MTECENTKKRMISSCTNLAGDHGAHWRDELRGFVGEKKKKNREEEEEKGKEVWELGI